MKLQKLLTAALLSAILLAGCTGVKFTSALINGEKSTVKTMLNNGDAEVNEEIGFGKTPIFYAVENNQHEILQLLLDKGAKVDIRDDEGRCPLTMAAQKGHNKMVKTMVKAGKNPDSKGKKGMTALMIYAKRKDGVEMAKYLVNNGADVNAKNDRAWSKRAIDIALLKSGNKKVAYYLLENGAKITEGALYSALKKDRKLAMKMLNSMDRVPSSALTAVIDDEKMFNYLLKNGANASAIIEDVARTGNIKALRKLAEVGADPNYIGEPLEKAKNAETARVLVEMGVDVNKGLPVHEAVMDEDAERVRFLVNEAGSNMNKQNDDGQTALHLAAWYQKFNMLKVLLKCKGPKKINLIDKSNENTVLDYIGTHDSRHVPDHWKKEYKGVSRKEIRKMLSTMRAMKAKEVKEKRER